MGLLQMEISGRPDGEKPEGKETYLAAIQEEAARGAELVLSDDQRLEIDREFLQFYHRRICCLALREFDRAVADADHTLALMDFVLAHSSDVQWTSSHERYWPFVFFHRTQAAAMAALERGGPRRPSRSSTPAWPTSRGHRRARIARADGGRGACRADPRIEGIAADGVSPRSLVGGAAFRGGGRGGVRAGAAPGFATRLRRRSERREGERGERRKELGVRRHASNAGRNGRKHGRTVTATKFG